MKSKSLIAASISSLFLLGGAYWGYQEFTGDFCLENITCEISYQTDKSTDSIVPDAQMSHILNQKFSWLGQGMQTYAFASEDGQYVLKIFKFKRLKSSTWTPYLTSMPFLKEYFIEREERRQRRIRQLFGGYEVAFSKDRVNTGLLYTHLKETDYLRRDVVIADRLGREHVIPLDQIRFSIQVRAKTTKQVFQELLQRGDVATVKQRIRALFDMYMAEYKSGILDNDQNILANTGFSGDQPLRIDIGRLEYNPEARLPAVYKQDLGKIARGRLNAWFLKHYPTIQPELAEDMQAKLSELFGESFALNN